MWSEVTIRELYQRTLHRKRFIIFTLIRSYALEQAIGYNIDYEPTQMH